MKKTFNELQEIDATVGFLYKNNKELSSTKFGYAVKRFTEKCYKPIVDDFNNTLIEVRIDHALEDPTTKQVLTDNTQRGFKYSKQGLKDVMGAEKKIVEEWGAKEFEVEPFISTYVPELTEEQKEILTGVLI